jgi:hypothetical protein
MATKALAISDISEIIHSCQDVEKALRIGD